MYFQIAYCMWTMSILTHPLFISQIMLRLKTRDFNHPREGHQTFYSPAFYELKVSIVGFCRSIYYDLEKTQVTYPAPSGWYLMGVVVKPKFRRHYIGHRITKERLIRISESSNEAYFVVNSNNQVSIESPIQLISATPGLMLS